MKSRGYLMALACMVIAFSGCKPKQSAYQKVYEAAQARPTVSSQTTQVTPSSTPAPQTTPANAAFQTEKVSAVDGRGIKQYSVVIGSFISKTNAESLKARMQNQGYSPILAQNEKGMYRVLVATFDTKSEAYAQRDAIKERYPEMNDAWLLERIY